MKTKSDSNLLQQHKGVEHLPNLSNLINNLNFKNINDNAGNNSRHHGRSFRRMKKKQLRMLKKRFRNGGNSSNLNCMPTSSPPNQSFNLNSTDQVDTVTKVRKLLGDDSIQNYIGYQDDVNFIQDLDMIILGASAAEYKQYVAQLRKEYNHLNDSSYNLMRLNGSSVNQNVMGSSEKCDVNSSGARCKRDKINNMKSRKIKKKSELLKTKKLLKKSVLNLNNRNNRNATNNFFNNQRTVRFKNYQENNDTDCILLDDPPTEIIVLDDDDDDDTKQNHRLAIIDNVQNESGNGAANHNNLNESDPKDIDVEHSEDQSINQGCDNPDNSIINITDSVDETFEQNININETPIASNIFFEHINNNTIVDEFATPSYNISMKGIGVSNKRPPKFESETEKLQKAKSDDSVIFVSESIDLDKFNTSSASKAENFIPLSGLSKNKHYLAYKKLMRSPPKINLLSESFNRRSNSGFKNIDNKNCSTPKFSVKDRLHNIRCTNNLTEKQVRVPKFSANDRLNNIKRTNNLTKKQVSVPTNLLTARELAENSKYSTNTYNPNKEQENLSSKRMVIIDGSNVAFAHSLSKEFSVKGLEICIEYFSKMGHEVKGVVPQFRLQRCRSTDPNKLEQLIKLGKIVVTPCKNLPGKNSMSYDDRFILQLAVEFDAAVVSNDNYRDLLNENVAFKKVIENRVIGYSWCNDMFILPKDPYGKNGPGLSVILERV